MSWRKSGGIRGRPGRDFHFQNRGNALRCQPINVAGLTTSSGLMIEVSETLATVKELVSDVEEQRARFAAVKRNLNQQRLFPKHLPSR